MKTNSSKFQYIFILGLVVLTASIARAKVADPQDEKNDVIDSSRIARSKLRQTGILSMETTKTSDTKNRLAQLIARLQALKPPKPKQTVAPEIQPVQSVEPKSVTGQSALTPPKENQTRTSNSRAVDEDLRDGQAATRPLDHLPFALEVDIHVDLLEGDPLGLEQAFGPKAIPAPVTSVNRHVDH